MAERRKAVHSPRLRMARRAGRGLPVGAQRAAAGRSTGCLTPDGLARGVPVRGLCCRSVSAWTCARKHGSCTGARVPAPPGPGSPPPGSPAWLTVIQVTPEDGTFHHDANTAALTRRLALDTQLEMGSWVLALPAACLPTSRGKPAGSSAASPNADTSSASVWSSASVTSSILIVKGRLGRPAAEPRGGVRCPGKYRAGYPAHRPVGLARRRRRQPVYRDLRPCGAVSAAATLRRSDTEVPRQVLRCAVRRVRWSAFIWSSGISLRIWADQRVAPERCPVDVPRRSAAGSPQVRTYR